MRISTEDITNINDALKHYLPHNDIQLYLYGSRMDDNLKGGDIDLIWIVPEQFEKDLNINKYKVLAEIKNNIGDQHIDLAILSKTTLKNDNFYSEVFTSAIKILP